MTASHKKEARAKPAAHKAASQVDIEAKWREQRRKIYSSFFWSLVITGLLIGIKLEIQKTDFGKLLESMTYDLLQLHLKAPASVNGLPVIVLDISDIPMVAGKGLNKQVITERDQLASIVQSLADRGNPPKAIGLDIDFSPDEYGYADPADPAIFDSFLKINEKIPVRVGVSASLALPPQKWLIDPKYIELASCVIVPNPEMGSARSMPEWLDVRYPPGPNPDITERCRSMGVALAQKSVPPVRASLRPFVETANLLESDQEQAVSKSEFLVDYSPIDILSKSPPEIRTSDDVNSIDVSNKIVLLGRTRNTADEFVVPGRPERVYPGVFLHACAAYTLLEKPLYQFTPLGEIAIDIGISVLLFGVLLIYRLWRHKQRKEVAIEHRTPGFLACALAALLTVFAVVFVRWTHLMWDDFILVAVVLVAHTPIEHTLEDIYNWVGRTVGSWRHASSSASGSHSEGE